MLGSRTTSTSYYGCCLPNLAPGFGDSLPLFGGAWRFTLVEKPWEPIHLSRSRGMVQSRTGPGNNGERLAAPHTSPKGKRDNDFASLALRACVPGQASTPASLQSWCAGNMVVAC